jgi:hypothetical protein
MTSLTASGTPSWPQLTLLGAVYFLIGLNLVYTPLVRYDLRQIGGIKDITDYLRLITEGVPKNAENHRLLRPLLPYSAKPVYHLLRARLGTDRAAEVAFVLTSCFFAALTALGLAMLVLTCGGPPGQAVVAGLLYLGGFWTVNHSIPGLVDGGEACAVVWLLWALHRRRVWLAVPIVVLGALTKETFVAFSFILACGFWLAAGRARPRWGPLAVLGLASFVGFACWMLLRYYSYGTFESPASVVRSFDARAREPYFAVAARYLLTPVFWFAFLWMLPAALLQWRAIPRTVSIPCVAAACVAFVMAVYHGAGPGNSARPIFSLLAPFICWGGAMLLCRLAAPPRLEGRSEAP